MHGLFFWLTLLPAPATWAILVVVCLGVTWEIREWAEGTSYTCSKSSFPGIPVFLAAVLTAIPALQRGHISPRLADGWYHFLCFLLAVAWAAVAQVSEAKQSIWQPKVTAADTYHNVIAAPLQFFLFLALAPVTWMYQPTKDRVTMVILFAFFAVLLVYDYLTKRLNQREWMFENNFDDVLQESDRL